MQDIQTIGQIAGRDVQAITLRGAADLRLCVITYGARLTQLWVPDRHGHLADIVLGHDRVEEYQTSKTYLGATCGRYSNRIAGGRFNLDGQVVQLDCNEGAKHLHGGRDGFDRKVWQIADVADNAVTLTAEAADGEMGYPGALSLTCRYSIDADNRVWIEMGATTSAPTVINMVNHSYFNMAGQQSGDVLAQHLRVGAGFYTPVDGDLIPTGEVLAVVDTPFDFNTMRRIGAALPGPLGFDHNWCLSNSVEPKWGEKLRFCAEAVDPASGRRVEVWTTELGVQLYTGGYFDDSLPGKNGAVYGPFSGFTLETQTFPDSPNRPQFPSARLNPGQTYRHLMAFDFTPA